MKILVATTARLGHLRPLLPFVAASVASGHQVAVAAPRVLNEHASAAGLRFLPFDDIPADELEAIRRKVGDASVWSTMDGAQMLIAHAARAAIPGLRAAVAEYRPDLIVRNVAELASLVVAQSCAIAEVSVTTTLHSWMRQVLGASLPMLEMLSNSSISPSASAAISLLPESFDPAEGHAALHRFRRPSPPTRARPSRPLIYVSYGPITPSTEEGAALLRKTVAALAGLPVNIVVRVGRSSTASWRTCGTNVYPRRWVDEDQVLARADAVVCHGGAGTTLSSLQAGVPLLVLPQACDQPAIADAVAASGVGLRLGRGHGLEPFNADSVRSAVVRLMAESSFRGRAQAIAGEIAVQQQAQGAVELFEHLAA